MKKILFFAFIILLIACSKKEAHCERWEIQFITEPITGCTDIDLSFGTRHTVYLDICGKDLNDAVAGNTIITSEDKCCRRSKKFIRKV